MLGTFGCVTTTEIRSAPVIVAKVISRDEKPSKTSLVASDGPSPGVILLRYSKEGPCDVTLVREEKRTLVARETKVSEPYRQVVMALPAAGTVVIGVGLVGLAVAPFTLYESRAADSNGELIPVADQKGTSLAPLGFTVLGAGLAAGIPMLLAPWIAETFEERVEEVDEVVEDHRQANDGCGKTTPASTHVAGFVDGTNVPLGDVDGVGSVDLTPLLSEMARRAVVTAYIETEGSGHRIALKFLDSSSGERTVELSSDTSQFTMRVPPEVIERVLEATRQKAAVEKVDAMADAIQRACTGKLESDESVLACANKMEWAQEQWNITETSDEFLLAEPGLETACSVVRSLSFSRENKLLAAKCLAEMHRLAEAHDRKCLAGGSACNTKRLALLKRELGDAASVAGVTVASLLPLSGFGDLLASWRRPYCNEPGAPKCLKTLSYDVSAPDVRMGPLAGPDFDLLSAEATALMPAAFSAETGGVDARATAWHVVVGEPRTDVFVFPDGAIFLMGADRHLIVAEFDGQGFPTTKNPAEESLVRRVEAVDALGSGRQLAMISSFGDGGSVYAGAQIFALTQVDGHLRLQRVFSEVLYESEPGEMPVGEGAIRIKSVYSLGSGSIPANRIAERRTLTLEKPWNLPNTVLVDTRTFSLVGNQFIGATGANDVRSANEARMKAEEKVLAAAWWKRFERETKAEDAERFSERWAPIVSESELFSNPQFRKLCRTPVRRDLSVFASGFQSPSPLALSAMASASEEGDLEAWTAASRQTGPPASRFTKVTCSGQAVFRAGEEAFPVLTEVQVHDGMVHMLSFKLDIRASALLPAILMGLEVGADGSRPIPKLAPSVRAALELSKRLADVASGRRRNITIDDLEQSQSASGVEGYAIVPKDFKWVTSLTQTRAE